MSVYELSILITNYNTLDFVELTLDILPKITSMPYKVLINDNGSKDAEIQRLKKLETNNENIFVNFRKTDKIGSYAHGEALDILIDKVVTPYFVVLDSDCTVLLPNWDQYLISRIQNDVKCVGSPVYKIDMEDTDKFPHQFLVMHETKTYKNLKISCSPKEPISQFDTCWEWAVKYKESQFNGETLPLVNTRFVQDTPFKDVICIVYYTIDKQIIGSHFGRGSTGGNQKYLNKNWIYRLPKIGHYFLKRLAKKEKHQWINTCSSIVQNLPKD
ncbi:MAG: glycosyltransferase [Candidatus Cloacimonetes bacterium]|nr:glycosyltransferase [Candidatus Cloacimonadota bacterium]